MTLRNKLLAETIFWMEDLIGKAFSTAMDELTPEDS